MFLAINCDAFDDNTYNKEEFWSSDCSVVYLAACGYDGE